MFAKIKQGEHSVLSEHEDHALLLVWLELMPPGDFLLGEPGTPHGGDRIRLAVICAMTTGHVPDGGCGDT